MPLDMEKLRKRKRAWSKKRYATDPKYRETALRRSREGRKKYTYGLTQEAFDAMFARQLGGCRICGCLLMRAGKRFLAAHIDHSHVTRKVRGLLCGHCNTAIGHMDENPARLRAAADYLERNSRA